MIKSESNGYREIKLGTGDEEILIKLLEEPFVRNSVGMVESPCFEGRTAVLFVDSHPDEERDFDYAALGYSGENNMGCIYMEDRVYQGLMRFENMATMIVLHELGHFCYNHRMTRSKDDPKQEFRVRLQQVRDGIISKLETAADEFAAKYIGYKAAADALEQLNLENKVKYRNGEYDPDETELSIKEVELRILRLREMRE